MARRLRIYLKGRSVDVADTMETEKAVRNVYVETGSDVVEMEHSTYGTELRVLGDTPNYNKVLWITHILWGGTTYI